jgi:hypothetical protein
VKKLAWSENLAWWSEVWSEGVVSRIHEIEQKSTRGISQLLANENYKMKLGLGIIMQAKTV